MEVAFARAQVEAGADLIGVGDAAASLIGPRLYEPFVLPYETEAGRRDQGDGGPCPAAHLRQHPQDPPRHGLAGRRPGGPRFPQRRWPRAAPRWGRSRCSWATSTRSGSSATGRPRASPAMLEECYRAAGPRYIVGAGCEVPARDAGREPEGPDRLRQEPPAVTGAGRDRYGSSPLAEQSLRDLLFERGVEFPCGRGLAVRRLQGPRAGRRGRRSRDEMRAVLSPEEIDAGWRLGCMAEATGPVTLEIAQWSIAVLDDRAEVPFEPAEGLGAVVDVGTTTLVAQLVDRSDGLGR